MKNINQLVNMLSKEYNKPKIDVLNNLYTIEGVIYLREQQKNLYEKNIFVPLTQSYYGLAAGVLSEVYKNDKQQKK